MRTPVNHWVMILLIGTAALWCLSGASTAQDNPADDNAAPPVMAQGAPQLTEDQIDQLLAPIALYPDSLLAQILPACAYPLEVVTATQWLRANPQPGDAAIDQQNWEPSLKALAHYPTVLQTLGDHAEWTQAVGAAFVNQQQDVMASIQRLRQKAMDAQNLQSTPEQQVVVEDNAIQILPASPELLYVPAYDPLIVYERRPERYLIVFGNPWRIGRWLDNDCDWRRHWVAVGSGWHQGWRFEDRRWRRDDHYAVRYDDRTRIAYVNRDPRFRADVPVTRAWTHNAYKPRPMLPPVLARPIRDEHRGWPSGLPSGTATFHPKPFELPHGGPMVPVIRTRIPPPSSVQATVGTFDGHQSGAEVRREVDRFEHSRSVHVIQPPPPRTFTPPPTRTFTPPPPKRTFTPPPPTVIEGVTSADDAKRESSRGHRSLRR